MSTLVNQASEPHINKPTVDWNAIDTVILDMDGTLLDLHYDNRVWNEIVPQAYAKAMNISVMRASNHLLEHMREIRGTIEFYSFEYWERFTGLDLVSLHRQAQQLIKLRPGVEHFLAWLQQSNRRSIVATNAHPHSLMVKAEIIDLHAQVDAMVSSDSYGAPKEDERFWHALKSEFDFAPERTLFVDDNEPVLNAAAAFGIGHNLTIATPDSQRPARHDLRYACFDDFADIMP